MKNRFWSKVHKIEGGCWIWTAYRHIAGYGGLTVNKVKRLAHRVAYEELVGNIPSGLTIDHLCKVPACVNPSHMEVVTLSENVRRARGWEKACVASGKVQKSKTHCPKGHAYDLKNTYITPRGGRDCKECRRAACRRNYHKYKV